MADALPFVIGMVITFVLVRWIFCLAMMCWPTCAHKQSVDNRDGEGARALSREALDQLSTMFPNIPPAILRAEYIRAGSVPGAVERLLSISANYPALPQEGARAESPVSPPKPKVSRPCLHHHPLSCPSFFTLDRPERYPQRHWRKGTLFTPSGGFDNLEQG